MTGAPLLFFYDFISPYSYLAWRSIHAVAKKYDREVEPVAILFAGLLDTYGQKGPAEIPPKRIHMFKQIIRLAAGANIKIEPPPAHPFNPLLALRVASLPMKPEVRRRLIDGLYSAVWAGGGGVTDPANVASIATHAGLDGERAVALAGEQEAKDRVRSQTEAAIQKGVFGVPTTIADGESFWGFDALSHLDAFLAGADPATPERLAPWLALKPSAQRKAVAPA